MPGCIAQTSVQLYLSMASSYGGKVEDGYPRKSTTHFWQNDLSLGQRTSSRETLTALTDSSAQKEGYAAQGYQRGGRGDNCDSRDERGRPNRDDYQGREGREHDNKDSIKEERRRHYYNKSNHLKINSRTRFRHETENRQKETRSDLTSRNRVDNTKKTSLYSSSSICFSARSPSDIFASASHHMSDQASYFSSMTPNPKGQWLVKGIWWILLPILSQGTTVATVDNKSRPGEFRNSLFVPSLNAHLISIGTATDAGAEILCTGNKTVFKMHGKVVMSGQRSGKDIDHLNIRIDNNNGLTFATAEKKKISLSIIHQRFAHLNCRSIKRMAENKAAEGLDSEDSEATLYPCNGSIYWKIHRDPFPKGRTRATRPNKIIQSDVGGLLELSPSVAVFLLNFQRRFLRLLGRSHHQIHVRSQGVVRQILCINKTPDRQTSRNSPNWHGQRVWSLIVRLNCSIWPRKVSNTKQQLHLPLSKMELLKEQTGRL